MLYGVDGPGCHAGWIDQGVMRGGYTRVPWGVDGRGGHVGWMDQFDAPMVPCGVDGLGCHAGWMDQGVMRGGWTMVSCGMDGPVARPRSVLRCP